MNRLAVINVVGLTEGLIGEHTPALAAFRRRGALARIAPAFPAVTCTAQSNYLTGTLPARHGIVGNGWYDREAAEVRFWKQSNHLVGGEKIWDVLRAREPGFTCAQLFWWFNMYSRADYSLTPRPLYPADGRKVFDIHAWPHEIRDNIKDALGEFPFFGFWGPAAGVKSPAGGPTAVSRWIADAAQWMEEEHHPILNLVYLPHLDYNLQRHGPFVRADPALMDSPARPPRPALNPVIEPDLQAIDAIVGDLITFFERQNVRVVLLSEYGISNVRNPVPLNRLFRHKGWLAIKDELGLETLDAGASRVFAVVDHQVAHIYVNDPSLTGEVRALLLGTAGVDRVLGLAEKAAAGLDHPRAGDLIAVAAEDAWFSYYYWLDDARAPDFARTVDIHRKPGYDPAELFLDPKLRLPRLKIARRLLQKKLGFRMLMDVIPLDASLVKGSHGRIPADPLDWPVFLTNQPRLMTVPQIESTDVFHALIRHVLREQD
jgi:predicted AlkP superfamily pyrophosphatase or phosphodiesterase